MTEPINPCHDVRAALRDAVLALGGVVAVRDVDDSLVHAIARALGAVVRRHIPDGAGTSGGMTPSHRLRPHPAIVELLARIGEPGAGAATSKTPPPARAEDEREWLRLPGLFRRWEFEQVIEAGDEYHVEAAGSCEDGTSLFAIYARSHATGEETR